ncbi:MAG: MotA/TolQ/ExbB proton channel family protein [Prevotellaceae bacterium]|nr:MotA/TolQ/ExbB proton channel family protein [Candidatus Colivivens equi]
MANILIQFVKSPINIGMIVLCTIGTILLWRKANETKSIQLRNYCSTLWTSVGILGTFVSIYISLSGMDFTSASNNAIESLIQNIIPAFSTSIIGIVGAIICTICNKLSIAKAEEIEENDFTNTKNKFGVHNKSNSPELILLEIVKSINDSCTSTNETLNGSKDVSDIRLKALIEGLGSLSKQMSGNHVQTKEIIEKALSNQNTIFGNTVSNLISKFQETLTSVQNSFKSEVANLTTIVDGRIQTLINSNDKILEKTVDLQRQELNLIKETLAKESKERNDQLRSFIESENNALKEFVEEQNTAFGAYYKKFDEQISAHVEKETNLFENEIKTAIEEFAKAEYNTCIETINECNTKIVDNSNNAINRQEQVNETFIAGLSEKLTSTCDALVKEVRQLSTDMADKLQRIHEQEAELIKETISNNRQDVGLLLETNKEQIEKVSDKIKENYDQTVSELTTSYEKMKQDSSQLAKDFNDSIVEANNNAQTRISEIKTTIIGIQQSIHSSLEALQSDIIKAMKDFEIQNETLKQHIKDTNNAISEDIAKQIQDAFNIHALEQACDRLNTSITNTISNLQSKLSIITGKLEETSNSVTESASLYGGAVEKSNEINAYIERTVDVFKLHKNALDSMQNSLTNMEQAVNRLREQWHDISISKPKSQATGTSSRTKK